MEVTGTEFKYWLKVKVRSKTHHLTLDKKDYPRAFTVVELPKEREVPSNGYYTF